MTAIRLIPTTASGVSAWVTPLASSPCDGTAGARDRRHRTLRLRPSERVPGPHGTSFNPGQSTRDFTACRLILRAPTTRILRFTNIRADAEFLGVALDLQTADDHDERRFDRYQTYSINVHAAGGCDDPAWLSRSSATAHGSTVLHAKLELPANGDIVSSPTLDCAAPWTMAQFELYFIGGIHTSTDPTSHEGFPNVVEG